MQLKSLRHLIWLGARTEQLSQLQQRCSKLAINPSSRRFSSVLPAKRLPGEADMRRPLDNAAIECVALDWDALQRQQQRVPGKIPVLKRVLAREWNCSASALTSVRRQCGCRHKYKVAARGVDDSGAVPASVRRARTAAGGEVGAQPEASMAALRAVESNGNHDKTSRIRSATHRLSTLTLLLRMYLRVYTLQVYVPVL